MAKDDLKPTPIRLYEHVDGKLLHTKGWWMYEVPQGLDVVRSPKAEGVICRISWHQVRAALRRFDKPATKRAGR